MKDTLHPSSTERGSITLLTVFLTGLIVFLLVFADNAKAVKEATAAQTDATTEQAFYDAQSCLEEGYLQLRFHSDYSSPYVIGAPLFVGTGSCTLNVAVVAGAGTLTADGTSGTTARTVVSSLHDAGPSTSRNDTAIFHILDHSGSMANDGVGCSDSAYTHQIDCTNHGELWGPRPMVNVQSSAISFLGTLDPHHDQIGLVSFSTDASLDQSLTTSYSTVATAIKTLLPTNTTNIGGALDVATANMPAASPGKNRVEILLTDGVPNVDVGGVDAITYAQNEAQAAKDQGIIVITIGLGSGVNSALLENLASTVSGHLMYYPAPNASQLDTIYAQIANILTTYNIGQGSWTEQ